MSRPPSRPLPPNEVPRDGAADGGGDAGRAVPPDRAIAGGTGWFALRGTALALLLGGVVYAPTLRGQFAYDDLDLLNQTGDVLAGARPLSDLLRMPHLEHVIPVLRLLFHLDASLLGVRALPLRLLVLLAHAASGVLLGLATRRAAARDVAGFATIAVWVGGAGLSSMGIWLLIAAGVPLGLTGIALGLCAIVHRAELGPGFARLLALAGIAWAVACENPLVPLAAGPVLLDGWLSRHDRRRAGTVLFAALAGVLAIGGALASVWLYSGLHATGFALDPRRGLSRFVFLVLAAPLRLVLPGMPLAPEGSPGLQVGSVAVIGGVAVLAATALLAILARGCSGTLTGDGAGTARGTSVVASGSGGTHGGAGRGAAWSGAGAAGPVTRWPGSALALVLASLPGSLAFVGLVALARTGYSLAGLYDADRYFLPLAVPLSLAAGIVAAVVWPVVETLSPVDRRRAGLAIAVLLLAELALHARAVSLRYPAEVFAGHAARFAQLRLLARRLDETAGALPPDERPLRFPDYPIALPDLHNGRISARLLLLGIGGLDPARVALSPTPVDDRTARVLDATLAAWAREIGEPLPFLAIANGEIVNVRETGEADFRRRPNAEKLVSGFFQWEGASRWMGRTAELDLQIDSPRLELLVGLPLAALRARAPDLTSIDLRAELSDLATGETLELGTIPVAEDGIHVVGIDLPADAAAAWTGRKVRVRLTASRVWVPVQLLPGSTDGRELGVQLFRVGFGPVR